MSHHPLWKGDISLLGTQEIVEPTDPIVFQAEPATKDHGSFIESISAGREWVWLSLSLKNDSILQELPCLLESSKKGAVASVHVLSPFLSPVFMFSRLSI